MGQDHRSQALKDLGIRTWRGAAMFGLQVFGALLPVLVGVKLVGGMLGITSVSDKSWWWVPVSAIAPAFGMFVAVSLIAEVQKLGNR
ncbi:hypothetical protein ACFOY5_20880 [Massilia aurea]|uniref:hypothetical protein n=1 Tax=Massilia aurea TaxID=373040 RepID=UPI00216386E3|nr:hypothetical protein [Massilia aurea]MCS0709999.1 hypothetical protein [Massilia aurea]